MSNLNDEMRNIELEYYKLYRIELYERLKQEQQWVYDIKLNVILNFFGIGFFSIKYIYFYLVGG